MLEDYNKENVVEDLSDYAVALIYLGDFMKAKNIYHQIEIEHPGSYTTASNLGTIYELIGKPDSALIWIQKSIDINPYSHGGSEWIHIKILEFKINENEDYSKSILGLYFGNKLHPKSQLSAIKLEKLQDHIKHQLKERGNFVKPKNLIVGSLYNDLGDIMFLQQKLDEAEEMYGNAFEYGFESDLMKKRLGSLISDEPRTFFAENFGWIALVGLLAVFGLIALLIRKFK
ncbi:MAG: tetratricopeptide (TPR) repeat protein [Maribacter sp.]